MFEKKKNEPSLTYNLTFFQAKIQNSPSKFHRFSLQSCKF